MHDRKLTFGELAVGERFICWPSSGDNSGHGGYKIAMRVFTKISPVRPARAHLYRADYFENGAREGDGVLSRFTDGMKVIKLCPPAGARDAVTRLGRLAGSGQR